MPQMGRNVKIAGISGGAGQVAKAKSGRLPGLSIMAFRVDLEPEKSIVISAKYIIIFCLFILLGSFGFTMNYYGKLGTGTNIPEFSLHRSTIALQIRGHLGSSFHPKRISARFSPTFLVTIPLSPTDSQNSSCL